MRSGFVSACSLLFAGVTRCVSHTGSFGWVVSGDKIPFRLFSGGLVNENSVFCRRFLSSSSPFSPSSSPSSWVFPDHFQKWFRRSYRLFYRGGGGGGGVSSSMVRAFAHGAMGRRIDPS